MGKIRLILKFKKELGIDVRLKCKTYGWLEARLYTTDEVEAKYKLSGISVPEIEGFNEVLL